MKILVNEERNSMEWKNRTAYVFIKTAKGKSHEVWQRFQSWDTAIGTWLVTGNYDVIVWLDTQDWDTIHQCISEIKNWSEVEHTSSHMVYNGHKRNNWWWEKPAGAWVLIKENTLNETSEKIHQWDWMTSGASIPGEWDYISWVAGENWEDVWHHLIEIKNENWYVHPYVPIKSWWNQQFKDKWW
jgi:hypothetical protein